MFAFETRSLAYRLVAPVARHSEGSLINFLFFRSCAFERIFDMFMADLFFDTESALLVAQ